MNEISKLSIASGKTTCNDTLRKEMSNLLTADEI